MKFKISYKYLNITNYPYIERELEDMAKEGWLLNRVIFNGIFIFKKIKPSNLEFTVAPYEIETAFNKKTKKEVKEFETVCEKVGWNYAAKVQDFHIYYKDIDEETVDIHTDKEEEFKAIEKIGKKQMTSFYFTVGLFSILTFLIFLIQDKSFFLRDGLIQVLCIALPVTIILYINQLKVYNKFLKVNRKNIDIGKSIEFNDSNFTLIKILDIVNNILAVLITYYFIKNIIFLENYRMIQGLIPVLLGTGGGLLFRKFIKGMRLEKGNKILVLVIIIVIVIAISTLITTRMINEDIGSRKNLEKLGDEFISLEDMGLSGNKDSIDYYERTSIVVPRSYFFSQVSEEGEYYRFYYSKTSSLGVAKKLMKYEIENISESISSEYEWILDMYYNSKGNIDRDILEDLENTGISVEELKDLEKEKEHIFKKKAKELILERSIVKINPLDFNVDDGYMTSFINNSMIVRKGKEVFIIEYDGKVDFTDEEIRDEFKIKFN